MHGVVVLVLLVVATAGACCARRPPDAPVDASAIDSAFESLLRAGCYRCLREALDLLPATATFQSRRFQTLVLLAARVRELGLPGEPDWLEQARQTAGASPSLDQQLLIDLAGATRLPRGTRPPMPTGGATEREDRARLGKRAIDTLPELARTDLTAAYFLQHAICGDLGIDADSIAADDVIRRVSLVAYKVAACGTPDAAAYDALLAAEPRFAEAHFLKAIAAWTNGSLLTTERELDVFDAAFPLAPASALLRGQVLLALEEFEPAVAALDIVLAADPDQPDALLYRMRAVSQLGDPVRGEAAASRLVTLGTWHQGEAYYWRAWNRRALKRLDEAATDVETAKRVLFNAAVPKLAGFIAYEREQLDLALAELSASRERNSQDCEVLFAIGQVHSRAARWADAADSFTSTIGCTEVAQAAAHGRMEEIAQSAMDEPRRSRLRARAERDLATEHQREGLATFNAAAVSVLADRPDQARALAERALRWTQWAERARALLDGLPPRPD